MKHAYLIMAHNNWKVLRVLLELLDDHRNDIFLHIDVKKVLPDFCKNVLKHSQLTIINPIKVYWADYTQVEATMRLLKAAHTRGEYSYYHLLSGTDLPIKTTEQIYSFFENSGREFIGIVPHEVYYSVRRVKYYHWLLHNPWYRKCKLLKGLDRVLEYVQKIFRINRLKGMQWKIMDGWNWFSITNTFVECLLANEEKIRSTFSNSIASDELFVQTIAYNSEHYKNLYDVKDLKNGTMRFIDWERGKPYVWGNDSQDFNLLMRSPYMFARKFDESQFDLVQQIYHKLKEEQHDKRTTGVED